MSNWGTTPKLPDLLPSGDRMLTYQQAIAEAMHFALASDQRVRVFGEGVTDPAGTYGTTKNLHQEFGEDRVFDVPLAEGMFTGMAVGMSLGGLRPICIHPRHDFTILAMDQIANHAAKWSLMFGFQTNAPVAIRAIACRGWGSAAQHSQSLHAMPALFPGLEIAVPFTPADAKGALLYAALEAKGPVLLMEHKWLWNLRGAVAEGRTIIGPGKPQVVRAGQDVTVVAISYAAADALRAADTLAQDHGIQAEVIDLRWLRPLDVGPICDSVARTGRLVVVDTGHRHFGVSGEIVTQVIERVPLGTLKARPLRVGAPDWPVPACCEREYFTSPDDIVTAAQSLLKTG